MLGTVISSLHTSILKTVALLGYFSDNSIGCCDGFTLKWLSSSNRIKDKIRGNKR